MPDIVDPVTRSRMMAGIRAKNTKPERIVRCGLHRLGFRFRLHDRKLSGTPDLVLRKHNAVIFVHGCFWHGHECRLFRMPGSRTAFWESKIARNRMNDTTARKALLHEGWRVLTIWECALRDLSGEKTEALMLRIAAWLRSSARTYELRDPKRKPA